MKDNFSIISALQNEAQGLYFISETDHPFEIIDWETDEKISGKFLRDLNNLPSSTKIEEVPFREFYEKYATTKNRQSEIQKQLAHSYKAVFKILEDNLTTLKVYRVGEIKIFIYIVGQSRFGGWLGLSTQAVET